MTLPALPSPRAQRFARNGLPLIALMLVGVLVLFLNYGSGMFNRWDEGLYGQFARNALTYHDYLLPLDETGRYSREPFSKPPLSFLLVALSFKLLGASIATLRLPFTLGMLLLSLICWAWGNDISRRFKLGPWLGFVWGLFILLSQAAMEWGRYAVIENVFVMFMLLALWLHTRALSRHTAWGLLSGVALALAFLTKQLAVGLAMAPMFVLELLHLREHGLRRGLVRTVLWSAPPLLVAALWAVLAYQREGQRFSGMLWSFALVQRFQGYQGTTHFNTFNRVSREIADALWPFPWALGALGLCVLAGYVWRRRSRGGKAELSPVLFSLSAALVLENATKSMLPWYVLSFVPGLTLGLAWLTTQGFRAFQSYLRKPSQRLSPYWVLQAALCVGIIFLALVAASVATLSQVNVVIGLLAAGAAAWAWARRTAQRLRWLPAGMFGASLCLLTLVHFRDNEYWQSPGTFETLMGAVSRAGVQRPVVSAAVSRSDIEHYEPITLFGTQVRAGAAPWSGTPAGPPADGFIDLLVLPEEAYALLPGRIQRAPGATLYTGDLHSNPLPAEALASLLAAGPLNFEAEWMDTARNNSLVRDSRASGGLARHYKPWLSEGNKGHEISRAATLPLPAGDYVANTYVRWECGPHTGAEVGAVKAGGRQRKLSCKTPDHLDAYRPISARFSLGAPASVALSVTFERGRGQLWHDKTSIWRADVWQSKHAPPPAE